MVSAGYIDDIYILRSFSFLLKKIKIFIHGYRDETSTTIDEMQNASGKWQERQKNAQENYYSRAFLTFK